MADTSTTSTTPNDNTPKDRLSSLPDELLHLILSFLETEYLVQTSILSNRWRNFWCSNPILNLDMPREIGDEGVTVINRCLQLHNRPAVNKLSIDVTTDQPLSSHVKTWVEFATTKHVRELDLCLDSCEDPPARLPEFLFHHTPLTKLGLIYCSIKLPNDFKGLPFLTYLKLRRVGATDKAVTSFISTCPLLERLALIGCEGLKNLNISAPNLALKFLDVRSCYSLKKLVVDSPKLISFTFQACGLGAKNTDICLTNVPLLREAKIDFTERISKAKPTKIHDIVPAVRSLAHVNTLLVTNWICQFIFAEYFVLKNPHFKLTNLKELRWSGCFNSEYELFAFSMFLGDCPSLETLCLNCASEFLNNSPDDDSWYEEYNWALNMYNSSHRLEFFLPQLKTVKLIGLKGTEKEIDLLLFLMCKATNLESVILASLDMNRGDDQNIAKLQQKLSRMPRGSRQAKIVRSTVSWAEFHEKYFL